MPSDQQRGRTPHEKFTSDFDKPLHKNKGWLHLQYNVYGKSMAEIAKKADVSDSTIYNWIEKHGIETRQRNQTEGRYTDEEWLREQYIEQGKSSREIADECDTGKTTILRWIEKHGIKPKTAAESRSVEKLRNNPDWLRKRYSENGATLDEIADELDVSRSTVRYWMKKHGIDTRGLSDAQLERWGRTMVMRKDVDDPDDVDQPNISIEKGGATYRGSPLGMDHVVKQFNERNVVEVYSPWRDEEWLKHQYHELGKTVSEVADECDVHYHTVERWMDRNGIDRRSNSEAHLPNNAVDRFKDPEWLYEQYWEEEKSSTEIANQCGVTDTTIVKYMDDFGIERRSQSEARRKGKRYENADWLYKQYWEEEKTQREIAEMCDVGRTTIQNWMKKHGIERR